MSRRLLIVILVLGSGSPPKAYAAVASDSARPCLNASQALNFIDSFGKAHDLSDAYPSVVTLAFGNAPRGVTAYEENRSFVYAAGAVSWRDAVSGHAGTTQFARRFLLLRPSVVVVDDEISIPRMKVPELSCFESRAAPQTAGRSFHILEGAGKLSGEVLFPQKTRFHVERIFATGPESQAHRLNWALDGPEPGGRSLYVLESSGANPHADVVRFTANVRNQVLQLTIRSGGTIFHLSLPPLHTSPGSIAVSSSDGKRLLDSRPFPSGVLPHDPESRRLLQAWDRDYRGATRAPWDIGQPSAELRTLVEGGSIRACRAVDLCCGSGSDAVYLARYGFKVTAIDIAPTALSQGIQKAESAGVSVNWVLADVLALPSLKPFDFVYDRGCYHVVRNQNLNAYLEAIHRLSHPGTEFLLLAARRDEGPGISPSSGVAEDEIDFDFGRLFQIEQLREIRLQSNVPGPGPPGWEVFMRRNVQP